MKCKETEMRVGLLRYTSVSVMLFNGNVARIAVKHEKDVGILKVIRPLMICIS